MEQPRGQKASHESALSYPLECLQGRPSYTMALPWQSCLKVRLGGGHVSNTFAHIVHVTIDFQTGLICVGAPCVLLCASFDSIFPVADRVEKVIQPVEAKLRRLGAGRISALVPVLHSEAILNMAAKWR